MGSREAMVNHIIAIANDDSHGYSWADRWNVDRDCSSLMYDGADAGGYPVGKFDYDYSRYTGTMIPDFTSAGFTCLDYGSVPLERGDVLLRDPYGRGGHTEIYIGDGLTCGAHIAETGDVYGEPGDQTGFEISITPNPGGWDYILRPEEDDMAADQVWNYGLQGPNANMPAGQRLVDIQRQFYRTDDASGRGMEVPFIERLAWMAAKQGKQNDLLVAIAVKIGIDPKEAREMLDVDPSKETKGDE